MKRNFTNRYGKSPLKAILLSLLIIFICASAFCGCVSAAYVSNFQELKGNLSISNNYLILDNDITLEDDIEISSPCYGIYINKPITLDLKGKTITFNTGTYGVQIKSGGNLTVKDSTGNGKIISKDYPIFSINKGSLNLESGTFDFSDSHGYSGIQIWGSKDNVADYSKFTLGKDAKLVSDGKCWAVGFFNADGSSEGFGIVADIYGKIKSNNGAGITISGNLQPTDISSLNLPKITIHNGAEIYTPNDIAIYGAGYGIKWIFEKGCTITGYDALSIKAGNWIINGGTFTATGNYQMLPKQNGNGPEPTGAAISITDKSGYAKNVELTINDGTFISKNQSALYEGINDEKDSKSALTGSGITINGGTFTTKNTTLYPIYIRNLNDSNVKVTLNGQTPFYPGLNTSAARWVKGTDGNWTVTLKEDITNLESINLSLIDGSKKATLELNGKKITLSDKKDNLIGWNNTSSTGNIIDLNPESTEFKGSKAYYPLFEYNVTFNGNGGTGTMDNQPFVYNASQKLNANNFTKDEYVFAGWNTEADGSGTSYTNEQPITIYKDITLYAVWTLKPKEYETGEEVEDDEPTPTIEPIPTAEPTPIVTPTQNQTVIPTQNQTVTPTQNQTVKPTVKPTPEPKTVVIVETEVKFEDNKVITSITVPEGSSGSITFTQTEEKGMDEWIPESIEDSYSFDLSCDGEINGDSEIHFVMSDVILKSLGLTPEDVCLKHFENGVWVKLKISYIVLDDGTYYYTAVTKSFSPFEITFDAKSEEPTITPTEEKPTKSPMPIVGLLAGLGAAVLVLRRK
ncbi:MAG TPA: InlB B-repeat-containing protein [Methanocorpusculum sp.]|nr:InlB B-repeat-containing protein [Methanocorpusculum sp.]